MAGGTFKLSQPKVRPGTYVNVKNGRQPTAAASTRGVAIVPLIGTQGAVCYCVSGFAGCAYCGIWTECL